MLIYTNKEELKEYREDYDRCSEVLNFRLYYRGEPSNLIWYDGKIIYIPKECFELKNLVNIDIDERRKCALRASEVHLIEELENLDIKFILEPNLKELLRKLKISGIRLDENIAIELIDDTIYSNIIEPIYLGNGAWLNVGS